MNSHETETTTRARPICVLDRRSRAIWFNSVQAERAAKMRAFLFARRCVRRRPVEALVLIGRPRMSTSVQPMVLEDVGLAATPKVQPPLQNRLHLRGRETRSSDKPLIQNCLYKTSCHRAPGPKPHALP